MLLVVLGGLFYADLRGTPQMLSARQWMAWVLQPVTWAASLPQSFSGISDQFASRKTLIRENKALKQRQLVLSGQLLRMQALEAENKRIRALLASSTVINHRVLIAEITRTSQDPYRHQILINKGKNDGVYRGQALVDAYGVLGQVVRVLDNSAVALLITDPNNGVPVEINRTGLQTVAVGRGDGQTLSLPFLPNNADVHIGDLLVTSGLGGRYPAGYPVGRVKALKHPAGDSFMEAIAQPAAHLNRNRQVLLVWTQNHGKRQQVHLPIDTHGDTTPAPRDKSGTRHRRRTGTHSEKHGQNGHTAASHAHAATARAHAKHP